MVSLMFRNYYKHNPSVPCVIIIDTSVYVKLCIQFWKASRYFQRLRNVRKCLSHKTLRIFFVVKYDQVDLFQFKLLEDLINHISHMYIVNVKTPIATSCLRRRRFSWPPHEHTDAQFLCSESKMHQYTSL